METDQNSKNRRNLLRIISGIISQATNDCNSENEEQKNSEKQAKKLSTERRLPLSNITA